MGICSHLMPLPVCECLSSGSIFSHWQVLWHPPSNVYVCLLSNIGMCTLKLYFQFNILCYWDVRCWKWSLFFLMLFLLGKIIFSRQASVSCNQIHQSGIQWTSWTCLITKKNRWSGHSDNIVQPSRVVKYCSCQMRNDHHTRDHSASIYS